ncbi:alba-domain-containing protein [Coccomyxa subellipsoidea C-169]|uniref:Alba-domain-containing protein n=1 Tax=Coccomyxa subellipsoidea (strain C-169) TaxID=574566 RepID=I0YRA5_COCSC|nr:alba-domain-containing protein [Coccomyxa subellipsoidea C-169]EIE20924.1 alba-domain-containing protein [Coccomyxa subellipsoidea C-169]|eukprot:XP_005645468.1 alba-domain-containing protein [Coccomyxa subellipsoidea C-169]
MDRYVRVEQRKTEQPTIQENEVRIMAAGKMRNYISYATTLLTDKGHDAVVLKAMGRAINKTVTIAEIIKRRIMGLHQNTQIGSVDITDTWEPLEEGLNRLETTRHVSVITITLSTALLDITTVGYQAPIENELGYGVHPGGDGSYRGGGGGGGGRGRGRGGGGRFGGRGRGPPQQG